ncbi:unnamed protein product [Owenia fusiformis]|uniref:N-acetyltransferase domain-containing protein n=1 Tax=Owenia fusiformis TaxID=6347 RepID=A0A8S4P4K8_OWEFU|nr:unnamed protein product [Owenia fusiformis]
MEVIRIRPARVEDLAETAKWMRESNRLTDKELLEIYLRVYHNGVFVAVDNSDRPLGLSIWCALNPYLGVGTKVIIRNDMENRGIGKQLIAASKKCLGDRNIMVNSYDSAIGFWDKCGFQHEGCAFGVYRGIVNKAVNLRPIFQDGQISVGNLCHMDKVIAYDEAITGYKGYHREQFLLECIRRDSDFILIANMDENICGYLIVRKITDVFLVAPFMANTNAMANSLFYEMVQRLPKNSNIQMYVTEQAPHAIQYILEQYQIPKIRVGRALFTKGVISLPGMDTLLTSVPF